MISEIGDIDAVSEQSSNGPYYTLFYHDYGMYILYYHDNYIYSVSRSVIIQVNCLCQ